MNTLNEQNDRPAARHPGAIPPTWPEEMPYQSWRMRAAYAVVALVLAVLAISVGFVIGRSHSGGDAAHGASTAAGFATEWTCSMHPQVRLPKFGQCPICFMDLVPVRAGGHDPSAPRMTMSPGARALAHVETSPVERRELTQDLRMVGKIVPDETRITYVSSYVPGRLDRLFVNYTGIFVRKGDHLAEIYSPELMVAQREYLVALDAEEKGTSGQTTPPARVTRDRSMLEAARRKMELWGIPPDQIEQIDKTREPSMRMRIDAPGEGWVLERQGFEGMYVETGQRLFTLVDLRSVWILLDAYELDLPYLRYGQSVMFESEAFPGEQFTGKIAYFDPTLTEATRTVKVRINVPNTDVRLRPGMFVRAQLHVRLGENGAVMGNELAGKWISPMHPEIVKDGPGKCDVCGMDLVPAESLGYATADTPAAKALAIPATAPLLTGRRAIVYVELDSPEGPVFEGREVELGVRAGDYFVVKSGLAEGERVVTRGALAIDSALQIEARPSMMQAPATSPSPSPAPVTIQVDPADATAVRAAIKPAFDAYLQLTEALAADDADSAQKAAVALRGAVRSVKTDDLKPETAALLTTHLAAISKALPAEGPIAIERLRQVLPDLTAAVETCVRTFGHERAEPIREVFCPMAFDNRGARWLQAGPDVRNPYFGARMLNCGTVRAQIAADGREVR